MPNEQTSNVPTTYNGPTVVIQLMGADDVANVFRTTTEARDWVESEAQARHARSNLKSLLKLEDYRADYAIFPIVFMYDPTDV